MHLLHQGSGRVLVLRDGKFSVWCRYCRWRSPETPELVPVLALDHLCGEAGKPAPGNRPGLPSQVPA